MTAIRLEGFGGIAPRYSERLLPPTAATIASNVKLISGELRGLHEVKTIEDFTNVGYTVRRAFRLPNQIDNPVPLDPFDTWLPFEDEAVDFQRSPVTGDSYERYYYTGDSSSATAYGGVPKYNTRARLIGLNSPYRLGVPRPGSAPTVAPPVGGGLDSTRAYVYTFVSAYGEEGQPSDATLVTGRDGTAVAATGTLTGDTISVGNTVTINGTVYTYTATMPVEATATNVLTGLVVGVGNTVTIEGVVYTFIGTVAAPYDVKVGASDAESLDNLIAAINGDAGEGTLYGTGTVAHTLVTAAAGAGDTVDVTAILPGAAGNSIDTTDTLTSGGWATATLEGGVDGSQPYDVLIGASDLDSLDNLRDAINAGAGEGTIYGNGTVANTWVTAASGVGDTLDVTAITAGAAGNSITTTDTLTVGGWGAATLEGGLDTDTGGWQLTNIQASVDNPTQRNITTVRIYRTRPGISSTEFFQVADIALGTTSYADTIPDNIVAGNPLLESTTWAEPPAGLQGLTVHPGGFMVGFVGRDLYMSVPFRPHAWPVQYILTCQTEIKGLAVFNNSIVIATSSHPYVADGSSPDGMSLMKLDSIDPCVARRSMVTTLDGVYYASVQGIVKVMIGGNTLATRGLFTREEWYGRYNPGGVKAVPYGLQYIAFDTPQTGFIFSPAEQLAPLTDLDRFNNVQGLQIDPYTGEVYMVRANRVALWDPNDTIPYTYQWRSKMFDVPKPVNFGAMRVKFANVADQLPDESTIDYEAFNAARILFPLNSLNLHTINGVRTESIPVWPYEQNKTPIGGSPLFQPNALRYVVPAVTVQVWARAYDSTMQRVFSYTLEDEQIYRLPGDFKSDVWQFELTANTNIYSFAIAETAKELVSV